MPARTKTNKNPGLGKAIINRKAKEAQRDPNVLRIQHENENLRSVTHERDLDDFLNSAALADTDFTAERSNVKVISSPSIPNASNPYLLSAQESKELSRKHQEQKGSLRVPRRPEWDENTTREVLERNEREGFLAWRRGLAELKENHGLLLTPFERNIQVWRQLWRVIERSHLVVQIVDARNPLTFRCEDLENYVKELGVGKGLKEKRGIRKTLMLINKSDLLTRKQRELWADYFDSQNITYAFFSAFNAVAAQEQAERERRRRMEEEDDLEYADEEDEEEDSEEEGEEVEEEESAGVDARDEEEEDDEEELIDSEEEDEDETADVQVALEKSLTLDKQGETAEEMGLRHQIQQQLALNGQTDQEEQEDDKDENPRTKILSVSELEDLLEKVAPDLTQFASEHTPNPDKLIVGLVGYPNVGKSSTINALLGEKKVSVSATPGKTKHFQTLQFSPKITLCDCPGLVFPQFVHTEADMVCDGVLPIDQMREYTAPIELICRRIPLEILERHYGIKMEVREIEDGGTGLLHWEDLLSTYAIARGLTRASFGMPDTSRAARYVLKDYVNAKLVYSQPPAGLDGDEYMAQSRAKTIAHLEDLERQGKKKAPTTRVAKGADTFVASAGTLKEEAATQVPDRKQQATNKSIRQSAASAPGLSARGKSKALETAFFNEAGPSAMVVAKGAPGLGQEGGFSRTKLYPHTQMVGNDGVVVRPTVGGGPQPVKRSDKKHFKMKDGKKRSGKGYD